MLARMAISLASVVFRQNVRARSQFGEDRRLSHLPDRERLGQRGDARRRQLDRSLGDGKSSALVSPAKYLHDDDTRFVARARACPDLGSGVERLTWSECRQDSERKQRAVERARRRTGRRRVTSVTCWSDREREIIRVVSHQYLQYPMPFLAPSTAAAATIRQEIYYRLV